VLFRSAAALLEDLHRQTPEGRRRKLRMYANVGLLCVDEGKRQSKRIYKPGRCGAELEG
jgi:hypothetical protein